MRLDMRAVSFSFGPRAVLDGFDLHVGPGELVALLGPNGSGKSTVLHLACGLLEARRGTVELDGLKVGSLSRREIARRVAVLPQDTSAPFDLSVRDVVRLGRLPHRRRLAPPSPEDEAIVDRALSDTDATDLGGRSLSAISGGERQRVHLARALAQACPILLLDEPTAGLDLRHAIELMTHVRRSVRSGAAAVVSLHDVALASRFCDRVVLLHEGRALADGPSETVLDERSLTEVFGIRCRIAIDRESGTRIPSPTSEGMP